MIIDMFKSLWCFKLRPIYDRNKSLKSNLFSFLTKWFFVWFFLSICAFLILEGIFNVTIPQELVNINYSYVIEPAIVILNFILIGGALTTTLLSIPVFWKRAKLLTKYIYYLFLNPNVEKVKQLLLEDNKNSEIEFDINIFINRELKEYDYHRPENYEEKIKLKLPYELLYLIYTVIFNILLVFIFELMYLWFGNLPLLLLTLIISLLLTLIYANIYDYMIYKLISEFIFRNKFKEVKNNGICQERQ